MKRRRLLTLVAALAVVGLVPTSARADDPPPTEPPPAEPPAPEPPALRSFTVAATGDILAHTALNDRAWRNGGRQTHDYRPMFADIQPLIAGADLAICHLEGPIAPPRTRITGQPVFGSPAAIASSIAGVGYDRCSTASNHSLDRGVAGIAATIEAFQAAGLGFSGTARSPEEAVVPILDVRGVKVAHLAYSYGFNGRRRGEVWRANLIDPVRIVADATDARARGAEVVIVSLHWGSEFRSGITGKQRSLARTLTESGTIDLIVGHHAHVLQPIEQINGKWVVYGLGNIVSNQRPSTGCPPGSQDGVVMTFQITENAGGGFTVQRPVATPTWVYTGSYVALQVKAHLDDPTLPKWVRNRLRDSLKRTTKVLGAYVPA